MKPLIRRASADRDVESAVEWYLMESGPDVALKFIDALQDGYAHIARNPATGSPRSGQQLGIDGLRSWPLRTFPYIVFYLERADAIEVWRVLHGLRDIPVHLQDAP